MRCPREGPPGPRPGRRCYARQRFFTASLPSPAVLSAARGGGGAGGMFSPTAREQTWEMSCQRCRSESKASFSGPQGRMTVDVRYLSAQAWARAARTPRRPSGPHCGAQGRELGVRYWAAAAAWQRSARRPRRPSGPRTALKDKDGMSATGPRGHWARSAQAPRRPSRPSVAALKDTKRGRSLLVPRQRTGQNRPGRQTSRPGPQGSPRRQTGVSATRARRLFWPSLISHRTRPVSALVGRASRFLPPCSSRPTNSRPVPRLPSWLGIGFASLP